MSSREVAPDFGNKAIPTARNRLHRAGVRAKRDANLPNRVVDPLVVSHDRVRPQLLTDFVTCDDLPRALDQKPEEPRGLRLEDALAGPIQYAGPGVELVASESNPQPPHRAKPLPMRATARSTPSVKWRQQRGRRGTEQDHWFDAAPRALMLTASASVEQRERKRVPFDNT